MRHAISCVLSFLCSHPHVPLTHAFLTASLLAENTCSPFSFSLGMIPAETTSCVAQGTCSEFARFSEVALADEGTPCEPGTTLSSHTTPTCTVWCGGGYGSSAGGARAIQMICPTDSLQGAPLVDLSCVGSDLNECGAHDTNNCHSHALCHNTGEDRVVEARACS